MGSEMCIRDSYSLSTTASFSVTDKKVKNCHEIDTYGTSMINRSNPVLVVSHLYWCSKYNLSTILLANVANIASFVHKENTKEINV